VKRLIVAAALVLAACNEKKEVPAPPAGGGAPAPTAIPKPGPMTAKALEGQDLWAVLHTSQGDITVKFFAKEAPKTVANFVGLATGEKQWRDPRDGQQKTNTPLYDGTIFHRVIEGFMIQGGDPLGRGNGDPGYRFEDEFQSGHKFDKVGLLAMANAGPNTNGSQFFITTSIPTWLSGKHTIFGEVISGYDVAEAISKVPRGPMDKPQQDVVLKKVDVLDHAP
jgi:peptidyl-prolyl cis-trans isomerase A (cyclophilin A)